MVQRGDDAIAMIPQLGEPAPRQFVGARRQRVADLAIGRADRQHRLAVGAIAEGSDDAHQLVEPRTVGGGQRDLAERGLEPQPTRGDGAQEIFGDRRRAPTLARTARDEADNFKRRQRDSHRGAPKTESLGDLLLGHKLAWLDLAANERSAQPPNGLRDLRIGSGQPRRWIQKAGIKHVS